MVRARSHGCHAVRRRPAVRVLAGHFGDLENAATVGDDAGVLRANAGAGVVRVRAGTARCKIPPPGLRLAALALALEDALVAARELMARLARRLGLAAGGTHDECYLFSKDTNTRKK